jgi:hypothetical protein
MMQKYRPNGLKGEREQLFIATFKYKQPTPLNNVFEMGFTSETKASDVIYQLEIYNMPREVGEWRMLTQEIAVEKFNENQIVNEMSEVTL